MSALLEPGQACPTCSRRVPHPKTEKSPPTKKMAYWVPADMAEAHHELIAGWAEWLGCLDKPFYEARVIEFFGTFARQHEELKAALA